MSTRNSFDPKPIEDSEGYKLGVPGRRFTAFISDVDGRVYYPRENKKEIDYLCDVYQRRIKNLEEFTITVNNKSVKVPGDSDEAYAFFIGLPQMSWKKLKKTKPISDQLLYADIDEEIVDRFAAETTNIYNFDEKNANFRIYAEETFHDNLSHGIYMDVEGSARGLVLLDPIDIDYNRLRDEDRRLLDSFDSDRLIIDFAYTVPNTSLDNIKKLLDKLNGCRIDDVCNYFAGYEENAYISGLGLDWQERLFIRSIYTEAARAFYLFTYDRLCNAKHSLESNFCYLTRGSRSVGYLYTTSSFNADMFSNDNENFYFDIKDKKRIEELEKLLSVETDTDPALKYARLFLPYEGYEYMKRSYRKEGTIADRLPYLGNVSSEDSYSAAKQAVGILTYSAGEDKHSFVLYKRYLLTQGIDVSMKAYDVSFGPIRYSMTIYDTDRNDPMLERLLSKDGLLLSGDMFRSYLLSKVLPSEKSLQHDLEEIDARYDGKANLMFFCNFTHKTVKQRVGILIQDMNISLTDSLIDYFTFLFDQIFTAAAIAVRKNLIEAKDSESLFQLDKLVSDKVSYEPGLPLPYVSPGDNYYGFASAPLSGYFLCDCQKESIRELIKILDRQFREFVPMQIPDKEYNAEVNRYIVRRLGLPKEIEKEIDIDQDIFNQLYFEHGICHVCNHTKPVYHHKVFNNRIGVYSSYLNYINTNAYRHGIYPSGLYSYDDIDSRGFSSRYFSRFNFLFDEDKIDSKIRSFTDLDITKAAAILSCHYPLFIDNYYRSFAAIEALNEKTLKEIAFMKKNPKVRSSQLYGCSPLIGLLWDYYRKFGHAYAFIYGEEIVGKIPDIIYKGYVYDERFPLPYIHLGRVFNAYSDNANGDFWFCSCDKESMKNAISYHLPEVERHFSRQVVTAVTLGLSGFPMEFVSRYSSYPLKVSTVSKFVDSLSFKDGICHHCQKHSIPALTDPFTLSLPRKDSRRAEKANSENLILKDGLIIEIPLLYGKFRYEPSVPFNLDAHIYNELPYVAKLGNSTPDLFLKVLRPDPASFKLLCISFENRNRKLDEAMAAAEIIQKTYQSDPNVFIDIFTYPNRESSARNTMSEKFPAVSEIKDPKKKDRVINMIIGFLFMMFEDMFNEYADKERKMTDE